MIFPECAVFFTAGPGLGRIVDDFYMWVVNFDKHSDIGFRDEWRQLLPETCLLSFETSSSIPNTSRDPFFAFLIISIHGIGAKDPFYALYVFVVLSLS